MANILFISRYYSPEKTAAAVCVSETAKCLVKMGNRVTVLTTFPNYPTGVVEAEYRGAHFLREVIDGVCVIRVWSYTSANSGFLRRILAQLSFGCLAPFLARKLPDRPDVIIVGSPPLFNVIAAHILAWRMRCPMIFWVADLWPESAVQLGMLRNRFLIRLSEWLEHLTYRRADIIWVATEGIRDALIQRGISLEKLLLIMNGVDTTRFCPQSQSLARAELGWDDRLTLLYAGNHGLVYAMTTLLDAAERLQAYPDIHIILAGDGVKKAEMVSEAGRRNLKNITFLNAFSHDQMPLLWAAADICLIPLRKIALVEGALPIKMFEMMACARPFILGADGIARNMAEQARAGLVVEPENAEALVAAILYLRANPQEATALGLCGRSYVKMHLDYKLLTEVLNARIAELLGSETPPDALQTPISVGSNMVASANPELSKEAIEATQLGISVIPMPEAYEICTGKIPAEYVGNQWYTTLPLQSELTYPLLYLCWKKALDLVCGMGGLLILGLLLPIIALLISLDSPGPIFYSQERIGLRGKLFRIYKFRSMHQDAEDRGAMWAAAADGRVTKIGRFLRSTHMDELPQLCNILRGEMSLIGPRPERAEFVAHLEQTVPFYRSRLIVKPGLTGWAQVKYHYARSDNDALIKLQYDLYYIKRQSFMLDLSIILRTVFEVLSLRGS